MIFLKKSIKNIKLIKNIIFIVLVLCCDFTSANTPPLISLQNIADKIITDLQQHQSQLKNNSQLIGQIVNQQLIPYIDVDRMSESVIGRYYWQKAIVTQ